MGAQCAFYAKKNIFSKMAFGEQLLDVYLLLILDQLNILVNVVDQKIRGYKFRLQSEAYGRSKVTEDRGTG